MMFRLATRDELDDCRVRTMWLNSQRYSAEVRQYGARVPIIEMPNDHTAIPLPWRFDNEGNTCPLYAPATAEPRVEGIRNIRNCTSDVEQLLQGFSRVSGSQLRVHVSPNTLTIVEPAEARTRVNLYFGAVTSGELQSYLRSCGYNTDSTVVRPYDDAEIRRLVAARGETPLRASSYIYGVLHPEKRYIVLFSQYLYAQHSGSSYIRLFAALTNALLSIHYGLPLTEYEAALTAESITAVAVLNGHANQANDAINSARGVFGDILNQALALHLQTVCHNVAACIAQGTEQNGTFSKADIVAIRALPWVENFAIDVNARQAVLQTTPLTAPNGQALGSFQIILGHDIGCRVRAITPDAVNQAIRSYAAENASHIYFGSLGIQIMRCFGARKHLPALQMIYKYLTTKGAPDVEA